MIFPAGFNTGKELCEQDSGFTYPAQISNAAKDHRKKGGQTQEPDLQAHEKNVKVLYKSNSMESVK